MSPYGGPVDPETNTDAADRGEDDPYAGAGHRTDAGGPSPFTGFTDYANQVQRGVEVPAQDDPTGGAKYHRTYEVKSTLTLGIVMQITTHALNHGVPASAVVSVQEQSMDIAQMLAAFLRRRESDSSGVSPGAATVTIIAFSWGE